MGVSVLPEISGKNVLVTGVSGIGGGFAHLALSKAAGKVFAVDRDQKALDALEKNDGLVKICADVGTEEGVKKIASAVGDAPIHWVLLGAAAPKNIKNSGHNLNNVSRADMEDMMNTDVYGKLFLIQGLTKNLQFAKSDTFKARVFNLGAPFSDGPMPTGAYMIPPSWAGFAAVKAANRWLHEGMKRDMAEFAACGYGHPGLTKTSLTEDVAKNYSSEQPMNKMVTGRFAKEDFHTSDEAAQLFYAVFANTSDEDFTGTTWSIVNTFSKWGQELGVKAISDVGSGIAVPTK